MEDALRMKSAFLKKIYDNLFNFISKFINQLINLKIKKYYQSNSNPTIYKEVFSKTSDKTSKTDTKSDTTEQAASNFIQIIECFGFSNSENRLNNSLENLFINFTNDKLSNLLFDMLIKNEASLYKEEGLLENKLLQDMLKNFNMNSSSNVSSNNIKPGTINVTTNFKPRASIQKINFNKNNGLLDNDIEETLNACQDTNKGIFKLLDVQGSLINKGTLQAFCNSIKSNWPNIVTTNNSFYLAHFGSVVEYGAPDFIIKNVDSLSDDLKEINVNVFKSLAEVSIKNFKEKGKDNLYNLFYM